MNNRGALSSAEYWGLGGIAVALLSVVVTGSWVLQCAAVLIATAILVFLICRHPRTKRWPPWVRAAASLCVVILIFAVSWKPLSEQYSIGAILGQLKPIADLVKKYQNQDASLKLIIDHYERLQSAQSLFDYYAGKIDRTEHQEIEEQQARDLVLVLQNCGVIATPFGSALKIRLGPNYFRVVLPMPMRIPPRLRFTELPAGVTADVAEKSNLGFTVIFSPVTTTVKSFGIIADAEF
jgi:hypothetical protein